MQAQEFRDDGDFEAASSRDFEEKIALARGVIAALERTLRTSRLYKSDHPVRQEATREIQMRFRNFFEKFAYLRLEVTQTELKLQGRSLMKCEARETEAPFRLYKDGIREIRFHRGLEQDELFAFLELLQMDAREIAEIELDLVSLLWSKDFKTIDHLTIDEFEMTDGEMSEQAGADLLNLGRGIRADLTVMMRALAAQESEPVPAAEAAPAGGPAASPEPAVDGHIPWKIPPTVVRPAPAAPILTPEELDALFKKSFVEPLRTIRETIEDETAGAVIYRTIALLSASFSEAEKVPATEIGPLLQGLLDLYARKGDFSRVGRLMQLLGENNLLDRVWGGAELWKSLVEQIQGPEIRKLLLTFLNSELADDLEGIEFYLELAGPNLVQDVCGFYGRVRFQKTRALLREYIKANGRSVPIAFKGLLEVPEAILPEVFELIRAMKPASAAVDLELAFGRLPRAHKAEALAVAATMEGIGRTRIFKRALAEPDPNVRAQAFKKAAEAPSMDLQKVIHEWIERPEFAELPWDEKVLAYRTFVRLAGPASLAYLKDVASRKVSLFGGQKTAETRRAAVIALGSLMTPAAQLLLEEWMKSSDRSLKEPATEALKKKP